MKDTIIVICGIDAHLNRIEECYGSLKRIYPDMPFDIGISTFGNSSVPPSTALKAFCDSSSFVFYDDERQQLPPNPEFHCCEILGMVSVSKHFYDMGYKEVFVIHNDMIILRDFLPIYRERMVGKWSFVLPFLNIDTGFGTEEEYAKSMLLNSFQIKDGTPYRLTQTIVVLNREFVTKLYEIYHDDNTLWKSVFNKMSMCGDCGLFDMAKDLLGYHINVIMQKTGTSDRWDTKDTILKETKSRNVYYIHGIGSCSWAKERGYV